LVSGLVVELIIVNDGDVEPGRIFGPELRFRRRRPVMGVLQAGRVASTGWCCEVAMMGSTRHSRRARPGQRVSVAGLVADDEYWTPRTLLQGQCPPAAPNALAIVVSSSPFAAHPRGTSPCHNCHTRSAIRGLHSTTVLIRDVERELFNVALWYADLELGWALSDSNQRPLGIPRHDESTWQQGGTAVPL
jgi:hypothetical protein